jgi:hypothetical protein
MEAERQTADLIWLPPYEHVDISGTYESDPLKPESSLTQLIGLRRRDRSQAPGPVRSCMWSSQVEKGFNIFARHYTRDRSFRCG